jgi:hypothetical protein
MAAPPPPAPPAGAPTGWDVAPARAPSMRYLEISGLRVRYRGPGSDDRDAAAVRANAPAPPAEPLYYFEVEVAARGRDGFIGVGFSVPEVKLDRLPGWEPRSYGYHGDDGHVFSGRGTGRPYGPVFGTGDWVGVLLNRVERTISFTKGGHDLGVAFEGVTEERLYPTVGFRTPDEEVVANFGADLANNPFRGDVGALRRAAQERLYARVLHAPPLPPLGGAGAGSTEAAKAAARAAAAAEDLPARLVLDYLVHHGCWEAAAAVARDALGGAAAAPAGARAEAAALRALGDALAAGDVAAAAEGAEALAPGVLAAHPRVAFALRCQRFVELVGAGADAEAVAYGRDEVGPACTAPEDRALLEEALTLFAYPDPEASPAAHLLGARHRAELAAALQRAVRAARGRPELSALEEALAHARAAHGELAAAGAPAAALLDVGEFLARARSL